MDLEIVANILALNHAMEVMLYTKVSLLFWPLIFSISNSSPLIFVSPSIQNVGVQSLCNVLCFYFSYHDDVLYMKLYNGEVCSNNYHRETIINFHCNLTAGKWNVQTVRFLDLPLGFIKLVLSTTAVVQHHPKFCMAYSACTGCMLFKLHFHKTCKTYKLTNDYNNSGFFVYI